MASAQTLVHLNRGALAAFMHLLIAFVLTKCAPVMGEPRAVPEPVDGSEGDLPCENVEPPDRQLIFALTEWIDRNTHYDVTLTHKEPPHIRFCKSGDAIDYEDRVIVWWNQICGQPTT